MRDDLVSIIMPAYRAATVIDATIASVVEQTYCEWELLVAEDCGPDDTRERVREWHRREPRVRLIEMAENGGPAAARNAALNEAQGRWIAFLDSDDLWLPDKLERQLHFHRRNAGTKITYTAFRRISAAGDRTGSIVGVPPKLGYKGLLKNTAIATSTVLVDKAATGPFAMRRTYYDDFACWLALLKPGGVARGLNEDLMRYRVMDRSVSRDKGNSAKQVWRAYRQVEGLSLLGSAWNFIHYAARAWLKYRRF